MARAARRVAMGDIVSKGWSVSESAGDLGMAWIIDGDILLQIYSGCRRQVLIFMLCVPAHPATGSSGHSRQASIACAVEA